MSDRLCRCTRPITTTDTLCPTCTTTLRKNLTRVPALLAEVDIAVQKLDRLRPPSQGGSSGRPLPVNLTAADARYNLTTAVGRVYLAAMAVQGGLAVKDPRHQVRSILTRWHRLTTHPEAGAWYEWIATAITAAIRVVDLPQQLVYTGPCGKQLDDGTVCDLELWARKDQGYVTCRDCGTQWDVNARRTAALKAIEPLVLTPELVSRALASYGMGISRQNIGNWNRKHLLQYCVDEAGRKTVRVGDVLRAWGVLQARRPNRAGGRKS